MRKINASLIKKVVAELCQTANFKLRTDVKESLYKIYKKEKGLAKYAVSLILENLKIAKKEKIAICQDTGMTVIFLKIGQDAIIKGDLGSAIQNGVKEGYKKGCLRASVVDDPIFKRKNTFTNTPAVIHEEIVKGNKIEITVFPKGFGSENTSSLKMFKPADSLEDIEDFLIEKVKNFGPNACPPLIVGIGIGGTSEKCMLLAKEALLRKIGSMNKNPDFARMEKRILSKINLLNIGPSGLGGKTTALAVNIEEFPTHIAGLPVAINISCWALRQAKAVI